MITNNTSLPDTKKTTREKECATPMQMIEIAKTGHLACLDAHCVATPIKNVTATLILYYLWMVSVATSYKCKCSSLWFTHNSRKKEDSVRRNRESLQVPLVDVLSKVVVIVQNNFNFLCLYQHCRLNCQSTRETLENDIWQRPKMNYIWMTKQNPINLMNMPEK